MYKYKCMSVCLSVVSYARAHLWADPETNLQNDPGALLTDIGDRMWNHPHNVPGGVNISKRL